MLSSKEFCDRGLSLFTSSFELLLLVQSEMAFECPVLPSFDLCQVSHFCRVIHSVQARAIVKPCTAQESHTLSRPVDAGT